MLSWFLIVFERFSKMILEDDFQSIWTLFHGHLRLKLMVILISINVFHIVWYIMHDFTLEHSHMWVFLCEFQPYFQTYIFQILLILEIWINLTNLNLMGLCQALMSFLPWSLEGKGCRLIHRINLGISKAHILWFLKITHLLPYFCP